MCIDLKKFIIAEKKGESINRKDSSSKFVNKILVSLKPAWCKMGAYKRLSWRKRKFDIQFLIDSVKFLSFPSRATQWFLLKDENK